MRLDWGVGKLLARCRTPLIRPVTELLPQAATLTLAAEPCPNAKKSDGGPLMLLRGLPIWLRTGLSVMVAIVAMAVFVSPTVAAGGFGVESFEEPFSEQNGSPATQAGSHPYSFTTNFVFNTHYDEAFQKANGGNGLLPDGNPKDLEFILPPGLVVNLLGVPRCPEAELQENRCPLPTQVGVIEVDTGSGVEPLALYNMVHAPGVPGELGFNVFNFVFHIIGNVRAGGNYAVSAEVSNLTQYDSFYGASVTLWGVPSAASHDAERGKCADLPASIRVHKCEEDIETKVEPVASAVERTGRPFLTLPTSCSGPLTASLSADSWQEPGIWTPPKESLPLAGMQDCAKVSFTPSIEVQPETAVADTPTGLSVRLKIPQVEALSSLAEASLKEAVVTLPAGLSVSPSALSGLGACSEAQIALASAAAPSCPESSKIASVEAVTPLLENKLVGSVYLAQQGNAGPAQGSNPFHSLIAMYLVVEGSGVLVKAPGVVRLNPTTGQLTSTFGEDPLTGFFLPQLPYSELKLNFFGGPRAPLVPAVCGHYTTTTQLTPYSAPESGPPATPQSSFDVALGCATGGFSPSLDAGTTSNQAGGYSPFVLTFARQDGEQDLGGIQVKTPPGLLGSIAHVPLCGEPQAAQGTCGAESQIGEVTTAVGPGPDPFSVTGGRAYLTGPYKGAPFGLSFVVPAEGGPFKLAGTNGLGDVVVRAAIDVDPRTSALTITSEPLPQILEGVPLQVRSVSVDVNRPGFMFNPTSCTPNTISATLQGSQGTSTTDSVPYQATDCASLAFAPKFSVSTSGTTSKADGASLDVKLTYPSAPQGSQADIAKVKVDLPKQLPSRLTTLQKSCLAATFEANPASCPAASVIGIARATTPLLPVPLTGPAYFVSYGGAKFPELIVVLQGDNVRVDLHGETFISKAGITSSTFNAIPDVPVGAFELYLPQTKYSALAANGNLCTSSLSMPTSFIAQNGAQLKQTTEIAVTSCPKAGAAAKKKRKHKPKGEQARRASRGHHKTGNK
jgi:hypothetical protein